MNIITAVLFSVICAVIVLTLKNSRPEIALLAAVGAGAVLLIFAIDTLKPYITQITDMADRSGASEFFASALKAVGICCLSEFAANTCTDFGQTSMAGKVRLMGRIGLLILALPYAQRVIEIASGLCKG
ncbi:MAG: hypothetical protein KBS41_04890 [Oscillospiraceae bacterium]|nr:hypothetical protein [Candidatus Equicaccousia limihippi]